MRGLLDFPHSSCPGYGDMGGSAEMSSVDTRNGPEGESRHGTSQWITL